MYGFKWRLSALMLSVFFVPRDHKLYVTFQTKTESQDEVKLSGMFLHWRNVGT